MKKLVYIFSLLLLACACNLEDFEPQTSRDADKVRLSLSLSVPEAQSLTRAMDDKPQLQTLHLVVFDQNGMLVEYAQAQNLKKATENGTLYNFDVALTISDTPRHIHFVGNSPAAPKFGMETEVMTAMETKSGADAYWYRKTIDKIEANEDGTPTKETKDAFGVIPLVRNFAKIVVTESADNFELVSYAIAGRPEKGKVVPYNRTKGDFQDFVKSYGSMKTYKELTTEGYDAFSPTGVGLDFDLADSDFDNNPKYVYERETPLSNASYVIVKGKYTKGSDDFVYYKVNLRDSVGKYVPLRRNFQYNINISSVTRNGYATVADALASSGSGDISTDLDFISLTNISDGEVRLTVEYTSKTLVSSDDVTLKVKFDKVGTNSNLELVKLTAEKGPKGETDEAIENVSAAVGPDKDSWYTYTITPFALSSSQKTQSLIITGTYTLDGGKSFLSISREVSYTLMQKKTMRAECIPSEVLKEQGQEFDLQITIPDGLGESMFPLEFSIEAVELSITPKNDNMPVESGKSTIPGSTKKSSFWFVKTLSYKDYKAITLNEDQTKSFLCHFATNKAISATDIYVSNPYFNQTSCTLGNYVPLYFQNLKYDKSVYPVMAETPVTFTFTTTAIPSQGNITVTLIGLIPAEVEGQPLENAGVDANGNLMYTLAANATSYTLNLVAADATTGFNVKLEAYHFVTAEKSATRNWMNFSNLYLPDTQVGTQDVNFRFTYAGSVVPVSIKLTNLESNDSRLLWNGSEYVFTPKSTDKTQTISLKTNSWGSQIGVEIVAAEGYIVPVSKTADRTLTATVSTGAYRWTRIYYSFDSSFNTSSAIGSQRADSDGNITITLSGDLGVDTREVYFWYSYDIPFVGTKTYTASTTLAALTAASPTLVFEEQK